MIPPPWLTKGGLHLRARALWAAVFAVVGLILRAAAPSPPPRTAEGVAAMLGAAAGGEVRADDFVWEERGGFLRDAILGRWVLFIARRPGGEAPGDLYRARVRLTRGGQPVSLEALRNLTTSPLGDDRELVARGHHAAFITFAAGAVQGITVLDLAGDAESREAGTWAERLRASLESWLSTGSTRGIGRIEVTFATPPAEAREEVENGLMVMALGKEALPAALDLRDWSLNPGPENTFGAVAQRIPHRVRPVSAVAAEAAAALLGPGAARAVASAFASIDAAAARSRASRRPPPVVFPGAGAPREPIASVNDWPPARLQPIMLPALEGEGIWAAGRAPAIAEGAPPCLFETAIRPLAAEPRALVRLVAIDTRQVDLHLVPGVDEPASQIGLRGAGRLPPAPVEPIAVFAGGPAEPAESALLPGFMADRRILAAPIPGAPTIAIERDGRPALGPWPFEGDIPTGIVSLRQAPSALFGGEGPARISPAVAAEPRDRSAVCALPSGQLLYAWGSDLPADALSAALRLAGCTYAVPLAAAPAPAGFAYVRGTPAGPEIAKLAPEMSLSAAQITRGSPNDLFYAVLRTPRPNVPPPAGAWAADAGTQPTPVWLPGIHIATAVSLGAQVHLTTFAPGRVTFRVRAGAKEPATKTAAALPASLPDGEQPRALAAIGLAAGKKRGARGLAIEGAAGYPMRGEDSGALVVDRGRVSIRRASEVSPGGSASVVELPLTADEGKLRQEARDVGTMRPRASACALDDGTFVVAFTTFDSDEAATTALLDLGCGRVVALDRGTHHAAFVHRAGTENPPAPRYDASVLYAVDAPLAGRAVRLVRP